MAAHNDSFATVESCVRWLEYAIELRRMELNTSKPGGRHDTEFRGYVRSLQVCLTVLGSYDGPLDGQCLSLPRAVLAYQRSKGLKPDGIVGRQTWLRIKADVLQALRAKDARPDT